jgi:hypothetical protein
VTRPPRFDFVPTLAVCLREEDAGALFADALGLRTLEEPRDEQRVFGSGKGVFFVDTRGQKNAPVGFLPLFVTEDLGRAREHLAERGYAVDPLPWAPDAPAFLVRAPGGASFCVGSQADVVERRARRLLVDPS